MATLIVRKVDERLVGRLKARAKGMDFITDLPGQPDDHILVGGRPDQRLGLDGLDVPGAAGRQHRGRGQRVGQRSSGAR